MTNATEPTARLAVQGDNASTMGVELMVREDPRALFRDSAMLPKLLAEIDAKIATATDDPATPKGRDAIRAEAHSYRTLKAAVDKAGLSMTEEWRKQTKEVNEVKREAADELEARYEKRRAPLTAWEEAEKTREETVRNFRAYLEESRNVPASATIAQIEKRRQKILDTQIDPEVYAELTERVQQEKEVALQALDAAKAAAEKVIADREELERLRAEDAKRREREAEEARQRVAEEEARIAREVAKQDRQRAIKEAEENARLVAEARAEAQRQATEAELRRKAQAEVDAANARAAEAERMREEMANRERAAEVVRQAQAEEDERRRKDQEHRATIFEQAAQDMTGVSGITMAAAKKLVQAIAAGSIRNVTVEF